MILVAASWMLMLGAPVDAVQEHRSVQEALTPSARRPLIRLGGIGLDDLSHVPGDHPDGPNGPGRCARIRAPQLNHPNHVVLTRRLQAHLRWRNQNARHPDLLAAQRRERARVRAEKGQRWGRPIKTAA
jgi:hypothetical protein